MGGNVNHLTNKIVLVFALTSCFYCYSCGSTRSNSSLRPEQKLQQPKEARLIPHEFPFKSKQLDKNLMMPVNDPFYTRNWGLKEVNAVQAWQINRGNKKNRCCSNRHRC